MIKKIQKICSFQQFLPSSVFNTVLTGKSLSCKNNKILEDGKLLFITALSVTLEENVGGDTEEKREA